MPTISALDPRKSSARTQKVGGKFSHHVIGLFTNARQSVPSEYPSPRGIAPPKRGSATRLLRLSHVNYRPHMSA